METQICSFLKCDRPATSLCKTCQDTYLCRTHIQEHADSSDEDHLIKSISKRLLNEITLINNLKQAKAKIEKAKENAISIFANCIENLENLFTESMEALQMESDKISAKIECVLNGENINHQEVVEYLIKLPDSLLEEEVYAYKIFESISNISKMINCSRTAEIDLRCKYFVALANELNCAWDELMRIEKSEKITLKIIISNGKEKISKKIDAYSGWKVSALFWKINVLCGISIEKSIITYRDLYLNYQQSKNFHLSESLFEDNDTIYILLDTNEINKSERADCALSIDPYFQKRDTIILHLKSTEGLRWTIETSLMANYSELAKQIYFAFGIKTEDQRINYQGKSLTSQDFKTMTLKDLNFKNYSSIRVSKATN
ncbi:unnamed protein product [Blepharisma stoltei]|uniref:Ubiquitin-like domain-containing protein n=1 Tax=Blepharisma stoltei TaxID=1481888 RepID=A0AAU9JFW7_9CILI|nr:unnamed protein product [Blepharisma stoltei]